MRHWRVGEACFVVLSREATIGFGAPLLVVVEVCVAVQWL